MWVFYVQVAIQGVLGGEMDGEERNICTIRAGRRKICTNAVPTSTRVDRRLFAGILPVIVQKGTVEDAENAEETGERT